jgi:ABC-type spermidine/putrescine transport system permease subunit I
MTEPPSSGGHGGWLLLAPAGLLVVGLFLMPFLWLVRISFFDRPTGSASRFYTPGTFTLDHYRQIATDPFFAKLALTTVLQAMLVTVVVMLLAYPCAVLIHRLRGRARTTALLAVLLPKLTNLLVLTFGLLVLLSNGGPLNRALLALGIVREPLPMFANLFAVVVTEIVIIAPYPVLILVSLLDGLDPNLEAAARGMGAGPLRAFYETSFKLTRAGAVAGAFIAFNWAMAAYIGPVAMGSPETYTIAAQVHTETFEHGNWPLGAALATCNSLLAVALLGALLVTQRLLGRTEAAA